MRIVVLDGYTLNPGDLSWKPLEALGELVVHERTNASQVLERAKGADAIFTNKTVLSDDILKQLSPKLKFIGVLATGYNVVDVQAARKYNVVVSNIPTYGTLSVAQMVFALLLNITQNVGHHSNEVKKGRWASHRDWCFWYTPLMELSGKTMGIVGFGRIGQATGRIAQSFGMKVIAYDIYFESSPLSGAEMVKSVDELFSRSDVVSLHCNLTEDNKGMVNKSLLAKMKKTGIIINTSRGPLINEADLADALNNGVIYAAGLDVLSVEPPRQNALIGAKNCFVTPHIAWATKEARGRLMDIAVENLRAFICGKPQNDVRPKL